MAQLLIIANQMSLQQLALSFALVWHVAAVCASAIPSPSIARETGNLSTTDPAVVDAVALDALDRVHGSLWSLLSPLRTMARPYVGAIGLNQRWSMFSNPADGSEYARLRHYVRRNGSAAPSYIATEIIYPAHRDDRAQGLAGLVGSFRDKAIASSLERFLIERMRRIRTEQRESNVDLATALARVAKNPPGDLAPISRFFARRFMATRLRPGDEIMTTEFWFGTAKNPEGTKEVRRLVLERRLSVVRDYYSGPVIEPFSASAVPPRGAVQREADILWNLLYQEGQP